MKSRKVLEKRWAEICARHDENRHHDLGRWWKYQLTAATSHQTINKAAATTEHREKDTCPKLSGYLSQIVICFSAAILGKYCGMIMNKGAVTRIAPELWIERWNKPPGIWRNEVGIYETSPTMNMRGVPCLCHSSRMHARTQEGGNL